MSCGIYKIINQVNGKVYIGQSTRIEERWEDHKRKAFLENSENYNYPLYQAIRKYGLEKFNFEILEECSQEDLNQKEIEYISLYGSYPPEKGKGYNQTAGGNYSYSKLSEEDILKIIDTLKNSTLLQKEIASIFKVHAQTITNINLGKKRYFLKNQDYPIRKNGGSNLEKTLNLTPSVSKRRNNTSTLKRCCFCEAPINKNNVSGLCKKCFLKGIPYCHPNSIHSIKIIPPPKEQLLKDLYEMRVDQKVAKKYNISTMLLKKWKEELNIPRKRPLVDKMYEEEYLGLVKEEKPKRVVKPVLQISLETGEILNEFENCNQAAKYLGFQKSNGYTFKGADSIRGCCLGKIKKSHGYFWKYKG